TWALVGFVTISRCRSRAGAGGTLVGNAHGGRPITHMRIAPESSRTLARLLRRLFLGRRCPDSQSMTSGGPMGYPGPQPQGLYDPAFEHDACGVAFVADIHGRRSHDVVHKGLSALLRMDHRGARGAEPNTGDGAGI